MSQSGSIIFYSQVLESYAIPLHFHCVGAKSTHFINIGVVIIRDNRVFHTFTNEFYILQPGRNNHFFFISTILYQYRHFIIHKSPDTFHSFCQSTIVSRTIAGYNNRILPLSLCRQWHDSHQEKSYAA